MAGHFILVICIAVLFYAVVPAFGAFLNWMYFSDATLTFPQTLVLRYSQLEPEERRNPQVAGDYAKWFLVRLRAVEAEG